MYDHADVMLAHDVDPAPGAVYIGSEVLCFGRRASGELLTQGRVGPRTRIRVGGRPVWWEQGSATPALLAVGLWSRQRRLPPQVAVAVVGGCAFLHGLAHGRELAGMASGAGFLVASALVMLAGALPGERVRRMAGAAIGAAGLCLLAGVV